MGTGTPLPEADWLVEGDPLDEGLSELLVEAVQRGAAGVDAGSTLPCINKVGRMG